MKPQKSWSFFQMTPAEREAKTRRYNEGVDPSKTRPLSDKGQLLWKRAKVVGCSSKLRAVLSVGRQRLRAGAGIAHDDFWREVEEKR